MIIRYNGTGFSYFSDAHMLVDQHVVNRYSPGLRPHTKTR